jgi:protein gp37
MEELGRGATFGEHWPLPNVWLGVSIENDRYTFRADHLRSTPAAVRFLSLEPLVGPLPSLNLDGIDWVIVGGESGRGAGIRPMHPDWVRDIRDRCEAAGVAFFFKQWGQYAPVIGHLESSKHTPLVILEDGTTEAWTGFRHGACTSWGEPAIGGHGEPIIASVGKHEAGRELDGRTHDAMPELVAS